MILNVHNEAPNVLSIIDLKILFPFWQTKLRKLRAIRLAARRDEWHIKEEISHLEEQIKATRVDMDQYKDLANQLDGEFQGTFCY